MMTATIDNYLKYEKVDRLFIAMEAGEQVLTVMGVSIVPQIRFYRGGVEHCKLHGTIDYEGLAEFVRRY